MAALAAASAAAGVLALAPVGDHFPYDCADDDDQRAADDPGSHRFPPLCPVGQMVFVVVVFAHQHVDQEDQHDQRGGGGDGEARARCQQAQLVDDQGNGVGEDALVADGEAGPLAVVHLALDRADGCEAGRAQQVEQHEGEGCQPSVAVRGLVKALGDGGEAGGDLRLVALLQQRRGVQLVGVGVVQHAEHAHDLLLGHQAHDRRHGGPPLAKAQGLEHGRDHRAHAAQNALVGVLYHAEGGLAALSRFRFRTVHALRGGDGDFGGHFRLRRRPAVVGGEPDEN